MPVELGILFCPPLLKLRVDAVRVRMGPSWDSVGLRARRRGQLLGLRERGEVVIRGANVMRGYLGKPEETAKVVRDGWLHTGDVGIIDEDGYLRIVDRIKDMIIRGGENIYPKEIEECLYGHPGILEAAVVGKPDEMFGEVPVAFVATKPGLT